MISAMDIPRRGDRNMRRTLKLGTGAGAVAAAVTMVAGVASPTSGAPHQAASPAAAVALVNKHITRAQAVRIAEAKVPHSRAIEVESDDLHDRAVWKVTLRTPHGRVIVDVDKRTGKATIVRRDGGGHGDAARATSLSAGRSARGSAAASGSADGSASWGGRDVRDNDGARHELGDRQDREQSDRDAARHDRGDRHDDGNDHRDGDHGDGDR
jgi:uncharacterized membrane protein YkoI